MKIKDGKIIEQDGAEANIAVDALDVKGITLSETALTDVKVEETSFSADITTSFRTVTGMDVSVQNATINIIHSNNKITKVTIAYSTDSYRSEITYSFS